MPSSARRGETTAPEHGNRLCVLEAIAVIGIDRIALFPEFIAGIVVERLMCLNSGNEANGSKHRESAGEKTSLHISDPPGSG